MAAIPPPWNSRQGKDVVFDENLRVKNQPAIIHLYNANSDAGPFVGAFSTPNPPFMVQTRTTTLMPHIELRVAQDTRLQPGQSSNTQSERVYTHFIPFDPDFLNRVQAVRFTKESNKEMWARYTQATAKSPTKRRQGSGDAEGRPIWCIRFRLHPSIDPNRRSSWQALA